MKENQDLIFEILEKTFCFFICLLDRERFRFWSALLSFYRSVVTMLAVVDLEFIGVVRDAVFVIVILNGGADSLLGQNGAVDLVGGQTVQRFYHGLVGELERFFNGLALDQLGGH